MILDSEFPPDIRVENEIQQIQKLGYDISIACLTFKNKSEFEIQNNLKIYRKKISSIMYKTSVGALKFPFYFNFWRNYIREILNQNEYDILHIHDLPLAKVGIDIKKEFELKVLVDLHENWPALIADAKHTNTFLGKLLSSKKQWDKYEKNILKEPDTIITVVEEMKYRISKYGVNKEKIFIVPNLLNISTFPEESAPKHKGINLFYGGGLNRHRGLQIAIQGIALLRNNIENIQLIIAGDGSYKEELVQLSINLGVDDIVEFKGKMAQNDLLLEMKKCDIALIPHLRSIQTDNSSPNKLYQYMYAEKPILSSNCKSLKRVIEESNTGVTYIDDNPEDFAEKLIYLLEINKENILGKNGRKAVVEKYNWDENMEVIKKAYLSIFN